MIRASKQLAFLLLYFYSFNASAQIISTYAGGGVSLADNIPATTASLGYFGGVAIDSSGNVYIADGNRNKVKKVNRVDGLISTFAGIGTTGFSGDNGDAKLAELNQPTAIAFDKYNNLYIADAENNRIRKVDLTTNIITTIAGTGVQGFSGDSGLATAAQLKVPQGITVDRLGNIYISDEGNSRIRKIDAFGVITTVAGTGVQGFSGDGGHADSAEINYALGLAVDTANNLYIADWGNYRIRKIDHTTGIISTVVGNGNQSYNGENIPALAAGIEPFDLTFDKYNNMYIADYHNNRIRKIDFSGLVVTVAGNGIGSFGGDGGMADTAQIHGPEGVKVDSCGNIYVADYGNKRVRKVTYDSTCTIGAPLAIQLLSFTGNAATMSNMLYWQTSNEQSIVKFELQRSEDGRAFNQIATVATKNNSTSYSYTDKVVQNTCYYRLKILETSGAYSYSDVVVIRRSNSNVISLYPNPVREQLTVTGGNDIVVTNTLGQVVMNARCDNYQTNIDMSGLKSGLYYITAQDANGAISRLKFVKE